MDDPTPFVAEPEEDIDLIAGLGPRRGWTQAPSNGDTAFKRGATIDSLGSYHSRIPYILNVPLTKRVFPLTRTRPNVEKRLCHFCISSIITTDLKWGMHHDNYGALQRSAVDSCTLCVQLHDDVLQERTMDPEKLNWPLYRWNIRSPERTGDTEDVSAALVFRQIINVTSASRLSDDATVNLPERTFFLFQQSDPQRMQPLRSFGNHTFSEEAQQTIKSWINECDSNHPNCAGRADRGFIPTRLLDLNQHEDRVVLVDSRATNIRNQYTTLSYCWGRSRNLTLLAENIDQFMHEGVAISSLALTIQDAIKATRMLGVQYIWVDALCILQGSAGDFQFEVSLMLQVYRGSFVNLAASDSKDARDGIFRDRDGKRLFDVECQGRPNSKIFGNGIWRIVPRALWEEQILQAQLNTRGWVFQERLLSPRIIHFSRNQVFWDCATMSACENFPDGLPKPLDTGSNDRYWRWKLQDSSDLNVFLPTVVDSSLEQFWRNAVHNYSTCHLSFGVDKLVAIWGIVRFLIGALKERYADGMWERNLEEQLAWHVVGCQQGNGQPSTRQKGLYAPTWSWASIHGEIILPDRFAAVRDYQVVGHDGKEIAFDLIGAHKCSSHGPRTWAEQLKQYEARVEEIEELRMNGAQSSRTKPLEATDFSPIPRLRSPSIPIMGHIGKMILQKSPAVSVWTLTTFPIRSQGGYGVIEAFPDIQSDDAGHVLILILAMNLNSPEGDRGRKNQEFVKTYTGVGLMIDYNGPSESCNGHFVRKGAFQFNGTDFEVFRDTFIKNPKRHGITSDYDPEKGHKIWLD